MNGLIDRAGTQLQNLKKAGGYLFKQAWHYGITSIKSTLSWMYDPRVPTLKQIGEFGSWLGKPNWADLQKIIATPRPEGQEQKGYPLFVFEPVNNAWRWGLRSTLAPTSYAMLPVSVFGVAVLAKAAHGVVAVTVPVIKQPAAHAAITTKMTIAKTALISLAIHAKEEMLKSDIWRWVFHENRKISKTESAASDTNAQTANTHAAAPKPATKERGGLDSASLLPDFKQVNFGMTEWALHHVGAVMDKIEPEHEKARLDTRRNLQLVKAVMKSWKKDAQNPAPEPREM